MQSSSKIWKINFVVVKFLNLQLFLLQELLYID